MSNESTILHDDADSFYASVEQRDDPSDTTTLLAAERALLASALPMIRDQGITLIGISFTNLHEDAAFSSGDARPSGSAPP